MASDNENSDCKETGDEQTMQNKETEEWIDLDEVAAENFELDTDDSGEESRFREDGEAIDPYKKSSDQE